MSEEKIEKLTPALFEDLERQDAVARERAARSVEKFQNLALRWSRMPPAAMVEQLMTTHYTLRLDTRTEAVLIFVRTEHVGRLVSEFVGHSPHEQATAEMFETMLRRVPTWAATGVMKVFFAWMVDRAMEQSGEHPGSGKRLIASMDAIAEQIKPLLAMFAPPGSPPAPNEPTKQ